MVENPTSEFMGAMLRRSTSEPRETEHVGGDGKSQVWLKGAIVGVSPTCEGQVVPRCNVA